MRSLFAAAGGFLAGLAVAILSAKLARTPSGPAGTAGSDAPASDASGEAERLRAEIAELEAIAASLRSERDAASRARAESPQGEAAPEGEAPSEAGVPEPPDAALTADGLARLLEEKQHRALSESIEKLLLLGEPGYEELLGFLRQLARAQRQPLWTDRALQYAILAAAARNEDAAEEFAKFLLQNHDPADGMLREHLLRFLPSFVAYGGERFSELRRELESALVDELAQGNRTGGLWRTIQTMGELGLQAPIDKLEAVLGDPARKNDHFAAIQHLAARADDASVDLLLRYAAACENPKDPAFQQVLQALGRLDHPSAQRALAAYLESPAREVRFAAALAYFGRPREADAAPIALGFLGSDADPKEKQALLWQLTGMSPRVFEAVRESAGAAPEVRELVEKHAQTTAGRKGGLIWSALPAGGGNLEVRVQGAAKE
ncbi:MAG: HEAT repeat domain-containing protein [Planctomycetota bacterium]